MSDSSITENDSGNAHEKDEVGPLDLSQSAKSAPKLGNMRIVMKRALTATSILSVFSGATAFEEEPQPIRPTISRPLAGLTRKQLMSKVREFAEAYNLLDDLKMLEKGALVAQKAEDWHDISSELEKDEIDALELVKHKPWRQVTVPLLLTIAAACCGAITLGWDQGVVSGATLHYPKEMHIDPDVAGPNQTYYNWLTGVISAGPFLGAAGCAVWLSDWLNHYLGRKGTLIIASAFLLACPLGSAFTSTWVELLICRILLGFGIGFLEVTAPVYAAESSPQEVRGAMTINFQLFTAFGIFLGSTSNLIFEKVHNNWRYMLASPLVPVPVMVFLLSLSPESARWYLKWGNIHDAYKSLQRLRHHDILAARDLYLIHVQTMEEQRAIGGSRNLRRFAELFYKNRVKQATIASCIAHLAQVLSGINIVCLFSSTIFTELTMHWGTGGGSSSTALLGQHATSKMSALWGSWGFGLVNFVFTFPALWTIDRFGRRTLMLLTTPNLFWTLLGAGLCFLINSQNNGVELGLVLMFIYLYTAFYSVGMGPIAFCYSAESASQTHRELSVALAAFVNNATNALMSVTFFRMRQVFSTVGVFGFYAGLNVIMFIMVFAFVPETKQLSLEELDSVFAHPNREFMKYQFTQTLPFLVKRYVLRHKELRLVPLDEIHHIDHL